MWYVRSPVRSECRPTMTLATPPIRKGRPLTSLVSNMER